MKHPIHPMLVHFPIACWSIATCFDIFSQLYSLENVNISGVLILIGIVLALPTMLTGLIDMSRIDNDSPAIKTVNKHMLFVFMAWMLLTPRHNTAIQDYKKFSYQRKLL